MGDDFNTTAQAEMLARVNVLPSTATPPGPPEPEAVAPLPRWALVIDGKVFTVVRQADEPAVPGYTVLPVLDGDPVSPGDRYAEGEGFAPAVVTAAPNPTEWLIDVGPFFDRFGAAKMAILTSSSPVAKALVTDCMVRRWIDLRRPDLPAAVDMLIAAGVQGVDAALKAVVLNTPVSQEENMALRVAFFGGRP